VPAAILFALAASPAWAESSSVDAYAGQGAVFGKPGRPHRHGPSQSGASRREGRPASDSSTGPGSGGQVPGVAGSKVPGGNGGGSPDVGGSASVGSATGRSAAPGASNSGQARGKSSTTSTPSGSAATPAAASTPAGESAGAFPLSTLDLALILAGVLLLLATVLALRRAAPSSD
jgi:hypothetical protein